MKYSNIIELSRLEFTWARNNPFNIDTVCTVGGYVCVLRLQYMLKLVGTSVVKKIREKQAKQQER